MPKGSHGLVGYGYTYGHGEGADFYCLDHYQEAEDAGEKQMFRLGGPDGAGPEDFAGEAKCRTCGKLLMVGLGDHELGCAVEVGHGCDCALADREGNPDPSQVSECWRGAAACRWCAKAEKEDTFQFRDGLLHSPPSMRSNPEESRKRWRYDDGAIVIRLNNGREVLGRMLKSGVVESRKFVNDTQARRAAEEMARTTGREVVVVHDGGPVRFVAFKHPTVRENPSLLLLGNPGMTRAEALAEARRRWGKRARVQAYPAEHGLDRIRMVYESGNTTLGRPVVGGCGPTWEAAFADADRRAGGRTENPSAPPRVKKAWKKFHGKELSEAPLQCADIPGAPDDLMELGKFVDALTTDGLRWPGRNDARLCYDPTDRSLWVIGVNGRVEAFSVDGATFKTVAYRTYGASGKDHATYEHKFHRPYPTAEAVDDRAVMFQGGRYTVTDWIRR